MQDAKTAGTETIRGIRFVQNKRKATPRQTKFLSAGVLSYILVI